MKSVFCLPVFNQARELPGLLEEFRKRGFASDSLLFVNDGSTDGSAELVRNSGFPFIDVPENRGVGHSCMQAIDWSLARGYDVFGTMAANGKMLPGEMHRVLDPIRSDEADYVTGSRFLAGGESPNLPRFRHWAIPMVNVYVRLLTGARVTDVTCGYRAMRLSLFGSAKFDWHARKLETYGFESYLYAKVLLSRRIRWTEVPVTMKYPAKGNPYSKIQPVIGWWTILKPWIVARWDGKGLE